jgi:hypothetical protein
VSGLDVLAAGPCRLLLGNDPVAHVALRTNLVVEGTKFGMLGTLPLVNVAKTVLHPIDITTVAGANVGARAMVLGAGTLLGANAVLSHLAG